jgi:hypothetical protein
MRRLLLFCALLLFCGCHRTAPPRVLQLRVAVGPEIRRHPDWRNLVTRRVRAAAQIFAPAGLEFELTAVTEWDPPANIQPELRRWLLSGTRTGDQMDVGLCGVTAAGGEPGIAVPYDPRVLVFDVNGASETRQAVYLAHELGHALGAWHVRNDESIMNLPPGSRLDRGTAACIRLMRSHDWRTGAEGLDSVTTNSVQKLWTDAKADPPSNPLYRSYTSEGTESLAGGDRRGAEEYLLQAVRFAPQVASAHTALGNTELQNREYLGALDEFRKAVKLDPSSPGALTGLAAALLANGRRAEAIDVLASAAKANPRDSRAIGNLGTVLAGTPGRLDDGIAALRRALNIDPTNQPVKTALDAALARKGQGAK